MYKKVFWLLAALVCVAFLFSLSPLGFGDPHPIFYFGAGILFCSFIPGQERLDEGD